MKNLSIIACISSDRGLGLGNQLLWHLKPDMAFFRTTTMGHPVVMGSKTYASIGRPLPGRENIVLTRQDLNWVPNPASPDTTLKVFHDRKALDAYLETLPGEKFILGGASLYAMYIDQADKLYLTEVKGTKPADVFFPEFDPNLYQRRLLKTDKVDDVAFDIVEYTKK